ncbi:MAG TPA: hypothetical protein PKK26_13640, partial [Candidatus Wallbacteria bacterium]|nr:hypothetical protein [Candidatus Wallbacteria bacterium]
MFKKVCIVILILSAFARTCFAQATSDAQQTLEFKQGFNFIAFTVKPNDNAATFKSNNPYIEDIYGYSTASGAFESFSGGTLTDLSAGKGYIVKAASAFQTTINGKDAGIIDSITLKPGFNLVGISKPLTGVRFGNILKNVSLITGIYKWNAASGSFISVIKSASSPLDLINGIDPAITSGQSFFINAANGMPFTYANETLSIGETTITAE